MYSNSTNNLIATSQVFLMINVRVACRSLAAPLIKLPELDHSALCSTFPPVFLSPVAKIQSSSDDGAQSRAGGMGSTWPGLSHSQAGTPGRGTFHAQSRLGDTDNCVCEVTFCLQYDVDMPCGQEEI